MSDTPASTATAAPAAATTAAPAAATAVPATPASVGARAGISSILAARPAAVAAGVPTVAGPFGSTIADLTRTGAVHRISIPKEQQAAFVATFDPSAPAGKDVQQIAASFDTQRNLLITITYAP